jgi:hypothetical protein
MRFALQRRLSTALCLIKEQSLTAHAFAVGVLDAYADPASGLMGGQNLRVLCQVVNLPRLILI